MKNERTLKLADISRSILDSYETHGDLSHLEGGNLPTREVVTGIVDDFLRLLFPGFLEAGAVSRVDVEARTLSRVASITTRLAREIEKGLRFFNGEQQGYEERLEKAREICCELLDAVPGVRDVLATDIQAAYEGDPAAVSNEEIIVSYPGIEAIAVYRLAHKLYERGVPMVPRMMTEYAHSRTGIDIHPGATIGKRFFIDHGTGVVIGETTDIGENVKIYQGVTLGARSFQKDPDGRVVKGTKRHPNIEDNVTIYSGATILGGDVTIGKGSVIGGNVWLMHTVAPETSVLVRPPQRVRSPDSNEDEATNH